MASNGEIADAKLALATSQNPDVIAFANKMITDHTGENTAMVPVAPKVGVTLPTGVSPAMQAVSNTLMTLSGTSFDAAYINSEIAGHQMNLTNNYAPELQLGINPVAVGYAKTYQPQVESHLALATSIKQKYGF
jgi:putative membrane protein